MTRATLLTTLVGILLIAVVSAGCGRDTNKAGAKLIGVGYDPGQVQPAPEPAGGLIDFVNLNIEATNLDLSSTGMYYPGDPFMDGSDPFHMVVGASYVFHPALTGADEFELVSPKGPDTMDSCVVTKNRTGFIGSFTTVDLGDNIRFVSDTMRFELPRDPGDYPANTTDVFIYYIDAGAQVQDHPDIDSNWSYDEELTLEWDGGLPPEGAPVASVPSPSWAGDTRSGKPADSPTIYSPPKLDTVIVGNTDSPTAGDVMTFAASTRYLDSPLDGTGDVLNVRWEPWEDAAENNGYVVIQVKLLYEEELGRRLECPWDPAFECDCVDFNPNDPDYDAGAMAATDLYCDPDYQPDETVGNSEGSGSGDDNCDDGLDNDNDFYCDSDGCLCHWDPDNPTCPEWLDGQWMGPDPECARHYQTQECRNVGGEKRCFNVGGNRNTIEGALAAEMTCTVSDEPGQFIVSADTIEDLLDEVDTTRVAGAMLLVGRVVEERVTMPAVKDEIGNQVDMGQIRVRVSNVSIGRLAVDRESL